MIVKREYNGNGACRYLVHPGALAALFIFMIGAIIGGVFWGGSISARVDLIEKHDIATDIKIERMDERGTRMLPQVLDRLNTISDEIKKHEANTQRLKNLNKDWQ